MISTMSYLLNSGELRCSLRTAIALRSFKHYIETIVTYIIKTAPSTTGSDHKTKLAVRVSLMMKRTYKGG